MLYYTGETKKVGGNCLSFIFFLINYFSDVDEGDTVLDFLDLERERGSSFFLAIFFTLLHFIIRDYNQLRRHYHAMEEAFNQFDRHAWSR